LGKTVKQTTLVAFIAFLYNVMLVFEILAFLYKVVMLVFETLQKMHISKLFL